MFGLLAFYALATSTAQAAEYRRITLNDGRVLVAAIVASSAQGLELSTPQGLTSVGFDQVQALEEVDQATYDKQPVWTIVVLPPSPADASLDEQLLAAAADIPAVDVTTTDKMSLLTEGQRGSFGRCAADPACVQGFLDQSGAQAAISARFEGTEDDRSLVIMSNFAGAPLARREVSKHWNPNHDAMAGPLRQATEESLHLTPRPIQPTPQGGTAGQPVDGSARSQQAKTHTGPDDGTLKSLVWVPLPGMPSLAQHDWAAVATSWAIVAPGTAAMVAVAGKVSFSRPQLALTGVASYYLLTVAVNKAVGLRHLDATVAAAPLPGGGAAIYVTAPLGGRRARHP